MSTTIIYYEAKCKHCKHFKYRHLPKVNGEMSKKMYAFCENSKSDRNGHPLTLKFKAYEKLEL